MRQYFLSCILLFIGPGVYSQSQALELPVPGTGQATDSIYPDSSRSDADTVTSRKPGKHAMFQVSDTLALSDYMMSIERVNDNLNAIVDSATLSFELLGMSDRIDDIAGDIALVRQDVRDKKSVINIKNLYLKQSFATSWNKENRGIQDRLTMMYGRAYHARSRLKTAFSDSLFQLIYADSSLRDTLKRKLARLEKKWARADSITKSSIDSLNSMKVRVADNAISLSSILRVMDKKLDKAVPGLFGPEEPCLWQMFDTVARAENQPQKNQNLFNSERKALAYYFSQTSRDRTLIFVIGTLLFIWLFFKRKLLKMIRAQAGVYSFLHVQYLNNHPVLSVMVLMLCLMPFFDAYAPTLYIAMEYLLLLTSSSILFFNFRTRTFWFYWLALVVLFVASILTYLFILPSLAARLWLLALHAGIIVFIICFIKQLDKTIPYRRWIRRSAVTGALLCGLGVICNLFGRFSLSGIFGIAGIFAIVQAVVLPVFIGTLVEFILLQVQSSRMKKGVDKPFDSSIIARKVEKPLLVVAIILWFIMLSSNLNIYHNVSNNLSEMLTTTRTIGSISYKLISVLLFFVIIWLAHITQRLIGFLFGETGIETEDLVTVSKAKHSRLLITKLLILICGYLLAISASGLPIDKLTIILGALGVGIGMGLQNVVNNFVSGIILIFDGSLQIGDSIEINGQAGKVKEIGLRASTLSTSDGAEVIIPNGNILSQNIVNWTFSNDEKRVEIWFSITGDELDSNAVNDVINNTIKNIPGVIAHKRPEILYNRVKPGTSAITVRFWSSISNADNVKSEAMLQLCSAFAAMKIEFE